MAAPAAFLAAATIAVLLVRAALRDDEPARPSPAQTSALAPGRRFHLARSGDTLPLIAARYDVTVRRLQRLNPGLARTGLRAGVRVRVR